MIVSTPMSFLTLDDLNHHEQILELCSGNNVVELIAEPPHHAKLLNDGVLLQLTKINQTGVTSYE